MRPEGWENQRLDEHIKHEQEGYAGIDLLHYDRGFEAGADAMLEGLRKGGERVDRKTTITNNWNLETKHQFEKGRYVFIPEEKE